MLHVPVPTTGSSGLLLKPRSGPLATGALLHSTPFNRVWLADAPRIALRTSGDLASGSAESTGSVSTVSRSTATEAVTIGADQETKFPGATMNGFCRPAPSDAEEVSPETCNSSRIPTAIVFQPAHIKVSDKLPPLLGMPTIESTPSRTI